MIQVDFATKISIKFIFRFNGPIKFIHSDGSCLELDGWNPKQPPGMVLKPYK